MNIEIKGVQFINKGAELMLMAALAQITKLAPGADIILRPNKGSPYLKRANLGAYQKLTLTKSWIDLNALTYLLPTRVRTWLKKTYGLVTEADVDVILDASGFAYGDQWTSIALRQLSSEVGRYGRKGKPYIFLPQALGPFTRPKDRKRLQASLPKAALILARERSSYEFVKGLGVTDRVLKQYPDFTNLVTATHPNDFSYNKPVLLIIPNSKMLSDKNPNSDWRNRYMQVLHGAVEIGLSLDFSVVVLNHEGRSDQAVCDALQRKASSAIDLINEDDALQVKGIIGASHLVLSSRFHGCVSALSQGVACLGSSWSYKYERLFEEYDRRACLLDKPLDRAALELVIQRALSSQLPDNSELILLRKKQSEEMWTQVAKYLQ